MYPPALESRNLTIGYTQRGQVRTVANDVNINLEKGKLTCLMGPNGIGKSTLIKTITGVLSPINGSIFINSIDLFELDNLKKAQTISVVLTDKPASGFMTVRDIISLGRYPYTSWQNKHNDQDQAIIDGAIESVGLIDAANTPLIELSDGNLQKAIIGRALAQDTDIIVLDEPTIHLDVNNKTVIIKILRQLCHDYNKTILLSTHDLELAMSYADRLWLFAEDQIYDGLPEDLFLAGVIKKVFSEVSPKENGSTLTNLSFKGDQEAILLLKQAIDKSKINADFTSVDEIEIQTVGNQLMIRVGALEYNSIEDFILKFAPSQL